VPEFICDSRAGRIHAENQDCVIARPPSSDGGIFLIGVADGISSCPFGRSVARWLIEQHLGKDAFGWEPGVSPQEIVRRYLARLNACFRAEFADLPEMLESGACLSLAVHLAGETHGFWVGDSPIYETSIQGDRISTRLVSRSDSRSRTSITDWFGGTSRFDLKHVALPIETAIVTITSDGAVHDAKMLNAAYLRYGFADAVAEEVCTEALLNEHADDVSIVAMRL